MKVLDHVPSTMETFVKNIFDIMQLSPYGGGVDFYQGIDPGHWRASLNQECWNEHGAYSFTATFKGDPTKPCWNHTLTAHLDIEGLYDDVRIEWKTTLEEVMEPQGLRKYWPGCVPALYGFIAQTYLSSLDRPVAAQHLQEFVALVTE